MRRPIIGHRIYPNWPKLKKGIELLVVSTAVIFVIRFLLTNWPMVASRIDNLRWQFLLSAWLSFLGYFVCRAVAWWLIMKSLGEKISPVKAGNIWVVSEFNRWIPGNIWSFLSRIYLSKREQIAKRVVIAGIIIEITLLVGTSVIFLAGFLILIPNYSLNITPVWFLAVGLPAIGLIGWPRQWWNITNWLLTKLKRPLLTIVIDKKSRLKIVLVFVGGWFAYGLGSYWVMAAFGPFGQIGYVWLVSAFVVAWLIGYISFITPMGIGVREGTIIAMLAPVVTLPVAGLIAIVTRLWFMVTELTVLGSVAILNQRHNFTKARIKNWWIKHWGLIILVGLILSYVGYFTTLTFLQQANFLTSRYDLGIMDQVVWDNANGRIFQFQRPDTGTVTSRFAIHADFFLIFLTPLYWIFASPYTLLLVQTVVIGLGALPLYWLAKERLGNRLWALLIAGFYLMYPPLQRANIFDFHAVTLATSFILFAFYFLYKKRFAWFVLMALLIISTKENMALIVAMMGLYVLIAQRNWKFGSAVVGLSSLWFYLAIWHIIPGARAGEGVHFAIGYYDSWGSSPGKILETLLVAPGAWLGYLLKPAIGHYLVRLLSPIGFLAILSPVFWLAIPELGINVLSGNPLMQTIYYQYTSGITPFAFLGAIFGWASLEKWLAVGLAKFWPNITKSNISWGIAGYLVIATIFTTWQWSPLPGMRESAAKALFFRHPAKGYLNHLELIIPPEAAVSATTKMSPHFGHRQENYLFPRGIGRADYVIVQEGDWFELFSVEEISNAIRQLEGDNRYERIYQQGTTQVFRKKAAN